LPELEGLVRLNPLSPNADIHPTNLGYAVMAGVVGADFLTH
jgi:hypothetical protein